MTTELYQITFEGDILEGFERTEVKQSVQALFRASEERVERLFSGTRSIIKSGIPHEEALRYQDRLTKAGASVELSPMEQSTATPPPVAPTPASADDAQRRAEGHSQATMGPKHAPMEFTGRGGEYFGIWIVNILLTILTLGIYSAWATVRNKQYFYGNTQLDNASFQYLASPITILKGRLIALLVLIVYVAVSELYLEAGVALAIGFIFVVPWIVIRSLRFNAINSAYRNVRFDFEASYGHAFMVTFVWPLLNLLTVLLLVPFSMHKTHKFIANGSRYGTTPFLLNNTTRQYYGFFGKGLLIALGFAIAAGVAARVIDPVVAIVIATIGYLVIFGYFMAGITNLFMNGASLDDHTFESSLQSGQMIWIYFSNSVLVLLTLGLFTPWAKVRMARYRVSRTAMLISGDLDHFVAAETDRTSALGQELGDAFDVDFAAI